MLLSRYLFSIALVTASIFPTIAQSSLDDASRKMEQAERLFYYIDTETSYASLTRNISRISTLAPAGYSVDEDGIVWGEVDPRVLQLAREHDVPVMPLIVNPGFDQEMLSNLLASDAAQTRATASMAELCQRHGYDGIQFDFENVSIDDRDALTQFYRETADALRAVGCRISIAVVHRPDALPGPTQYHKWLFRNWRSGYDLQALGEIGDFISIMTYSQHTRRTPPGPNAAIPWMEDVIDYFLQFVPTEKLSLGIPTTSLHWYTSQEDEIEPERARSYANTLTYKEATGLAERYEATWTWDEEQSVSYTHFSRGGTWEWIFLEDARSFRAKHDLVERYGLRGFSVWVLGREDPTIWDDLPPQ